MKLFFVFAFCISTFPGLSFAQEKLAEHLFKSEISAPTIVEYCADAVWAYSVDHNELWSLDPQKGTLQQRHRIDEVLPGELLTALTCNNSSFIVGTVRKFNGTDKLPKQVVGLYRVGFTKGDSHLGKPEKLTLPEDTLVRSINTSSVFPLDGFILVQNSVFKSNDLVNWKKLDLASSKDVKSVDEDLVANPFSDWQEGFLISQGRYAKAKLLPDGELMLLDPFRAHVVFKGKDSSYRWGNWGTRTGTMMFAKSFEYLPSNVVAVSDVGLKLIFFFDRKGVYLGSTGSDGAEARFGYPIDMASEKDRLYVADYFGNQIFAFKVKRPESPQGTSYKDKPHDEKSFAANNLFRHPDAQKTYDIVRCLNCHDGLEKYSLDKFILHKKRHPTGVVQKTEVDLPLSEGHKVDCFTCHQAHHKSLSGVLTGQFGADQVSGKLPYMLRKPLKELCLTCHKERQIAEHNHIGLKSSKLMKFPIEVKTCTQCHQLHSAEPKLLKKSVSNLCMTCHGEVRRPKSHPFGLVNDKTEVNCVSCHSIHSSEKELHFSRHRTPGSEGSCLNCHKDRIPQIGMNEHLSKNPKLKMRVKWADNAALCLNCHSPHDEKRPASKGCVFCHEDRVSKSHNMKIDAMFARSNIVIPNAVKLSNGWLTCSVCHDPHLPSTNKALLRPEKDQIVQLCGTACHMPEGALQRYENFHSRLDKKNKMKNEKRK